MIWLCILGEIRCASLSWLTMAQENTFVDSNYFWKFCSLGCIYKWSKKACSKQGKCTHFGRYSPSSTREHAQMRQKCNGLWSQGADSYNYMKASLPALPARVSLSRLRLCTIESILGELCQSTNYLIAEQRNKCHISYAKVFTKRAFS